MVLSVVELIDIHYCSKASSIFNFMGMISIRDAQGRRNRGGGEVGAAAPPNFETGGGTAPPNFHRRTFYLFIIVTTSIKM